MNVLIFTSAMVEKEFAEYQTVADIKPNPSNQNFYAKLIKALSFNNNVSVISHRPFVKGMFDDPILERKQTIDKGVKYYYTKIETSRFYKLKGEAKEIVSVAEKAIKELSSDKFVIVVDTLRINLLRAAKIVAKKHKAKIVGVLTDNPANLSNVKAKYTKIIIKNSLKLDGYLALSKGLLKAFKVEKKPNYIFEGLVDELIQTKKQPIGEYYFFGGALFERYGVKNLIDAFSEMNLKQKLVIAGNGPLKEYIYNYAEKNGKILYLSQLPKEQIYGLEQNSIANINPRPFSRKLDEESVPSKLLEYLASGVPTISTVHSKLFEIFKDDVFWITDSSKEGIINAIKNFTELDKSKLKKQATTARLKVFEIYGVKNQGERISYFLTSLSSSNN